MPYRELDPTLLPAAVADRKAHHLTYRQLAAKYHVSVSCAYRACRVSGVAREREHVRRGAHHHKDYQNPRRPEGWQDRYLSFLVERGWHYFWKRRGVTPTDLGLWKHGGRIL